MFLQPVCEWGATIAPHRGYLDNTVVLLALGIASALLVLLHGPSVGTLRRRGYKRVPRPLKEELRLAAARLLPSWQSRAVSETRLDSLPTELLHLIFLCACTDGGPTARSLALVSKRMSATSRGARFHSVSLLSGSHWSMRRLLDEYGAACDTAQREGAIVPRIRHLCLISHQFFHDDWDGFVSFADPRRREHFTTIRRHLKAQSSRAAEEFSTEEEWTAFMDAMEERYHATAETLLQTVAGDLETLCILQVAAPIVEPKPRPFHLGRRDFPRLRELWFFDDLPRFVFSPGAASDPDADAHAPPFPVLSRLHVVSSGPFIDIDFVPWVRDAPRLDTLRITTSSFVHSRVPAWVRNLLSATTGTCWPRTVPVHILVCVPPHESVPGNNFGPMHHPGARAVFDALQAAATPVVFVPYYCYQDVVGDAQPLGCVRGPAEVHRDWLARIAPAQGLDGIYVRDFWRGYGGDGFLRKLAIARHVGSSDLYTPPLIIWPEEGQDAHGGV